MKETAYTLIRSDRKTTAIRILTDGTVEVRAPRRLPVQEIERFLVEKQHWIETHREAMLEKMPAPPELRKILYMGTWKELKPADRDHLFFDGEFFYAPLDWDADCLKTALPEMMKKLAKKELPAMVQKLSAGTGLMPERVTVTGARTKWGSCSNGKNLSFSWRLMAAPPDAIAYVVWHELCHMWEMNHSPRFWALVETRFPDWRQKRERLAEVQSWLDAYYR